MISRIKRTQKRMLLKEERIRTPRMNIIKKEDADILFMCVYSHDDIQKCTE